MEEKLLEENAKLKETLRTVYEALRLMDVLLWGNSHAEAAVDEITLMVAEVLDEVDPKTEKKK
jgi:hypothetical protein